MTSRRSEVPLSDELPAKDDLSAGLSEVLPAGLSQEDQDILRMKYEAQLNHTEISNQLGISETACRSRLSRALARCKKILETHQDTATES